jgi:hypothetical protein
LVYVDELSVGRQHVSFGLEQGVVGARTAVQED